MNFSENKILHDPKHCLSGKISRINRLTANIFRKYLSPFGVTNSQMTLLFILSDGIELSQKEICDIAKLEKSSLHRNVQRLLKSNYISNDKLPKLMITSEGKKLVEAILPEWSKAMTEFKNYIRSDGEAAIALLHDKLTDNCNE